MSDNPEIWGPVAWKKIHKKTFNYPENPTHQDREEMYNFFMNLPNVLPCETCSNNLRNHLRIHPLTYNILSSKWELVYWTIDLHNIVNESLGKYKMSYRDVFNIYL